MHATLRDPEPPLTRSVEDYRKAIYHLSPQGGFAAASDMRALPEAPPPSGSGMVRQGADGDAGRLCDLAEEGVTRGTLLTVTERQPVNGPTVAKLRPSGEARVVGQELARSLWCRVVTP